MSTSSLLDQFIFEKMTFSELTAAYKELRKQVYCEETGLLSQDALFDTNDQKAWHYQLRIKDTQEIVAALALVPGADSDFARHTGAKNIENCVLGTRAMVPKKYRKSGLFNLLMYCSFSDVRFHGFKGLISFVEGGEIPAQKVLKYETFEGKSRTVKGATGQEYLVHPFYEDLNYMMHNSFEKLSPEYQAWAVENVMAPELEKTIRKGAAHFYEKNEFIHRTNSGTLEKKQYIASCINNHAYVRWTTRLLAKLVSISDDRELRNHYLEHLTGEVDHDLMLERDLEYLGANVDYVRKSMIPHPSIQQFMALQESLSTFYADPVLFMAVPLSIEAISAFMPPSFLKSLYACVKSWGYTNAPRACTFLSSHIHTDGAEDGHWIATRRILAKYLKSEKQLQIFLNTVHNVMRTMFDAYESFVTEIPTFGTTENAVLAPVEATTHQAESAIES